MDLEGHGLYCCWWMIAEINKLDLSGMTDDEADASIAEARQRGFEQAMQNLKGDNK